MRRSSGAAASLPASVVHELVGLYGELARDTKLARRDRERLRAGVRRRLLKIGTALARGQQRAADDGNDSYSTGAAGDAPAGGGTGGLGGGAQAADNGQALVELIQSTVAPSTWDVNGGQGTIRYWAPMRVLVVRQTSEVHGEVGALVGGLRQ